MTTITNLDQSSSSGKASSGGVKAPGNRRIAQVFVAGASGKLSSVRISVSYSGGGNVQPRVSLFSVSDGKPNAALGAVSGDKKDVAFSAPVIFSQAIPLVAGTNYAIVVDYPKGRSSDSFVWTAQSTNDGARPCFIGDGTSWSPQDNVCDFAASAGISVATDGDSTDSKGPIASRQV